MKTAHIREITVITAAMIFIGISAGKASAFIVTDVVRLKATKVCTKPCDLSGADLSKLALSSANVSGANMSNQTNLSGTVLQNANMTTTNLKGAIISSTTDFTGADLSGAIWTDGSVLLPVQKGIKTLNPNNHLTKLRLTPTAQKIRYLMG
ncbi:MAG: pentapeptide repeat-containing protein [Desulfuromonadales bacterium]